MRANEFLMEARRDSVILVDFQPHCQQGPNDYRYIEKIESAMSYINEKQPQVLAYFNGDDFMDDTKEDIVQHYIDYGLDEDKLHLVKFKEKSYGWLRNWTDEGVDNAIVIKVIRYLANNKLIDSRHIEDEVFAELTGNSLEWYMDREMNIYLPDLNIAELKALSGSLIGGGGRHECLKEMMLLMNAFNIRYKMVQEWIY